MKNRSDGRPLISIIVPFFNSEKYLKRAINSVICQSFKNYELLLVDDKSTDNSKCIALQYAQNYKNVNYIEGNGNGVSDARNLGIFYSQGEYLSFMDSDDEVMKDFFSKIVPFLNENKPDITFFNFIEIKKGTMIPNNINCLRNGKVDTNTAIESVLSNSGYKGFCWNKIYRKNVISNFCFNVNLFYLEDMAFNIDFLNHSKNIFFMNDFLYKYYWRSDSAVNKYSEKQLTYIDALNYIADRVPSSFYKAIILKKKMAYINFSSFMIFDKNKLFSELKNEFEKQKDVSMDSSSISKLDKSILNLANKSFTAASILFYFKRQILRSNLYNLVKSKMEIKIDSSSNN